MSFFVSLIWQIAIHVHCKKSSTHGSLCGRGESSGRANKSKGDDRLHVYCVYKIRLCVGMEGEWQNNLWDFDIEQKICAHSPDVKSNIIFSKNQQQQPRKLSNRRIAGYYMREIPRVCPPCALVPRAILLKHARSAIIFMGHISQLIAYRSTY